MARQTRNIFGVDLAQLLNEGINSAGMLIPGSLRRVIPGERNPDDSAAGRMQGALENYEFQGYPEQSSEPDVNGVVRTTHKVFIMGASVKPISRVVHTGIGIDPWGPEWGAAFGENETAAITIPTDTIPRTMDEVRFANDPTVYILGGFETDPWNAVYEFNTNHNTN